MLDSRSRSSQCEASSFIWDGHRRTSAALFANLTLIPIVVCANSDDRLPTGETGKEFVASAARSSWYYDREDVHAFRFLKYPKATD